MIKGCQKKMVIVKNISSDIFDEAYFILKDDGKYDSVKNDDMISEANRIVSQSTLCVPPKEACNTSFESGIEAGIEDHFVSGSMAHGERLSIEHANEIALKTSKSIMKKQGYSFGRMKLRLVLAFASGIATGALPAILYIIFSGSCY